MINNLDLLLPLMHFDTSDDFCFLQIIQRRKENPTLPKNAVTIKEMQIRSADYLVQYMPTIIKLCDMFNARAYLNINVKSFRKVALLSMKKLADLIMSENYPASRAVYSSACGEVTATRNKTWVIDIDTNDTDIINSIVENIESTSPNISPVSKIIQKVPTVNGVHLITTPFNKQEFYTNCREEVDIHTNNATILYVP